MRGCAALNGAEGMSSPQGTAFLQPWRGPPLHPTKQLLESPPGCLCPLTPLSPVPRGTGSEPLSSPQLGCSAFKLALGSLRAMERLGWVCRVRGRVQEHLGSPKRVKMCSMTCGTCMSLAFCHPAVPSLRFDHSQTGFSWELHGKGCSPVPPTPGCSALRPPLLPTHPSLSPSSSSNPYS